MPIRKIKDEIYILEHKLVCELGFYVLEKYPNIAREFKEQKEKMN